MLEGRGLVVNPTEQELQRSSLDLMLAGTADALLMIEGYCDFLSEEQMVEVSFASSMYYNIWDLSHGRNFTGFVNGQQSTVQNSSKTDSMLEVMAELETL